MAPGSAITAGVEMLVGADDVTASAGVVTIGSGVTTDDEEVLSPAMDDVDVAD